MGSHCRSLRAERRVWTNVPSFSSRLVFSFPGTGVPDTLLQRASGPVASDGVCWIAPSQPAVLHLGFYSCEGPRKKHHKTAGISLAKDCAGCTGIAALTQQLQHAGARRGSSLVFPRVSLMQVFCWL